MSLVISKVFTYDTDAGNYIQAVEAADGQALEAATRQAINNFVIGCKQDGIWSAIKASCILAGARTLSGALVPLAGTAPTNFNFVSGDYNRKTGLKGDGSTKYINTSYSVLSSQTSNHHAATFLGTGGSNTWFGVESSLGPGTYVSLAATGLFSFSASVLRASSASTIGFVGIARGSSSSAITRIEGSSQTASSTATTPTLNRNYLVFAAQLSSPTSYSNARLAFYSIGESLDLALLDARVTDLINAFGAAIP